MQNLEFIVVGKPPARIPTALQDSLRPVSRGIYRNMRNDIAKNALSRCKAILEQQLSLAAKDPAVKAPPVSEIYRPVALDISTATMDEFDSAVLKVNAQKSNTLIVIYQPAVMDDTYIDKTEITSFRPLKKLANSQLAFLYIYALGPGQFDLDWISGFSRLSQVALYGNFTGISPLQTVKDVFYLCLHVDKISDVAPLAKLRNVAIIDITADEKNVNTSVLSHLPNLGKARCPSADELAEKTTEGCFIATACCDAYDAPEVLILRQFRDMCLLPHSVGRMLVYMYYQISPPIAGFIRRHARIQAFMRRFIIQPIAYLANRQLGGM